MRKFNFSVSSLLLLSVLVCSCKKKLVPEPEPEPGGSKKGQINITIPQEFTSHSFVYSIFSSDNVLALTKAVKGGLTDYLEQGEYSLNALKYNDQQAKVVNPTSAKESLLVVNKESGSDRILPLTDDVYWAAAASIVVESEKVKDVALTPHSVLRYLDIEVIGGPELKGATIKGVVNGISDSFALNTGKHLSESSKEVVLQMSESLISPGVFTAKIGVLGIATQPTNGYLLNLEINKSDVVSVSKNEITAQIVSAVNLATIPIRVNIVSPTPPPLETPIRLFTSVSSMTKALSSNLDGKKVGVAKGHIAGSYTDFWTGNVSSSEIILNPPKNYPADGSDLFLCGFYPFASPDNSGNILYNLTGSEDIMWAKEQTGSLNKPFGPESSVLQYDHLLSQLVFEIEIVDATKLYYLREMKLNGLASNVTLSLASGVTSFGSTTFSLPFYSAGSGSGIEIKDGKFTLQNTLLVQPKAEITADMTFAIDNDRANDTSFKGIPIEIEKGIEGGNSYQVKIEFKDPSIDVAEEYPVSVSAKIIQWINNNNGGAEIKPE